MSVFGWSYPPGCSGPPEEIEYTQPQCWRCKRFVRVDQAELKEYIGKCPGLKPGDEWGSVCGSEENHEPHTYLADWEYLPICDACKTKHADGVL